MKERHLLDEGLEAAEIRTRVARDHQNECWTSFVNVLRYASKQIPIYRDRYREAGVDIERIDSPDDLGRVPILTKSDVRAHYPTGFIPDGQRIEDLIAAKKISTSASSGTSAGDRLQMVSSVDVRSKQMLAGSLLNVDLTDVINGQQSVLTSMHCADPNVCVREEPSMEKRVRDGVRHLLIPPDDPGAPTREELDRIVDELRRHKPLWLDVNPSYLASVSYAIKDAGIEPPKIRVITCGFEYLSKIHRRLLSEVWGCSVYNRYTASELGNFQILECERGALHVNDKYYYAEIIRSGHRARPGEMGRLIQTTVKETIPLVRYDTGDVFVAGDGKPCACGGVGMTLGAIGGRASDLISTPDGDVRTTHDVDDAVAQVEGVRFYQLRQTATSQYEIKVVTEPSSSAANVRARVGEAIQALLGRGAEIRVDGARRIYPEPSGKFRLCRSDLPAIDRLVVATS